MKALRYLLLVAAFATILLTSYSVLMALYSEPGDGGGGGNPPTWWSEPTYVNCGLDGMPGSSRPCVECKCVVGGFLPLCTVGEYYGCCTKGDC